MLVVFLDSCQRRLGAVGSLGRLFPDLWWRGAVFLPFLRQPFAKEWRQVLRGQENPVPLL